MENGNTEEAETMTVIDNKIAKLSTKRLIEMAEMLVNDLSDGAIIVAEAVERALEARMSEADYLAHVERLEALEIA